MNAPSSLTSVWLICGSLACCHRESRPPEPARQPASELQSIFFNRDASEEQLQEAFERLKRLPPDEDATQWVRIVNDDRSDGVPRRLAFRAFAGRFIKPGMDVGEIARKYGIEDWFGDATFLDWTYSSATPLDEPPSERRSGTRGDAGIYAVVAPDGAQPPRRGVGFCFSLARHLTTEEVRERIRQRPDGSLRITRFAIDWPDL